MKTKTKRRKHNKKNCASKKKDFSLASFFWPLTANLLWPMKSIYFLFFSLRAIPFLFLFILLFYALRSICFHFSYKLFFSYLFLSLCVSLLFSIPLGFRYVSSFCLYVILFIPIYVFNPFFFSINFTNFPLSD